LLEQPVEELGDIEQAQQGEEEDHEREDREQQLVGERCGVDSHIVIGELLYRTHQARHM
jgi:hypothetical protein